MKGHPRARVGLREAIEQVSRSAGEAFRAALMRSTGRVAPAPSCSRCRFGIVLPSVAVECRRRAPTARAGFPLAKHSDWCGEFEERSA